MATIIDLNRIIQTLQTNLFRIVIFIKHELIQKNTVFTALHLTPNGIISIRNRVRKMPLTIRISIILKHIKSQNE